MEEQINPAEKVTTTEDQLTSGFVFVGWIVLLIAVIDIGAGLIDGFAEGDLFHVTPGSLLLVIVALLLMITGNISMIETRIKWQMKQPKR